MKVPESSCERGLEMGYGKCETCRHEGTYTCGEDLAAHCLLDSSYKCWEPMVAGVDYSDGPTSGMCDDFLGRPHYAQREAELTRGQP